MNREILFRAKRRDNGEWVEGYVIQRYGAWFIYDIKNADTCIQNGYLVDSDTICQYTGLTDKKGKGTDISDTDYVTALLEDAAIIIDAYNRNATDEAKKLVSCNMVIRTLGSREEGVPIGTTQTTTTAMVYSQTWTNANGSGELYLTKLDKKILGVGNRIGYFNPYSDLMQEEEAND